MTTEAKTLLPNLSLTIMAAQTVLGWHVIDSPGTWRLEDQDGRLRTERFCESMDAAMLLVEALRTSQTAEWWVELQAFQTHPIWRAALIGDGVTHEFNDDSLARTVTVVVILAAGGNPYQEAP